MNNVSPVFRFGLELCAIVGALELIKSFRKDGIKINLPWFDDGKKWEAAYERGFEAGVQHRNLKN